MAKKATITDVSTGYQSNTTMNDNFEALNDAFDNTLSLDGSTPNAMGADLDMNANDVLNAGVVNSGRLVLGGTEVSVSDLANAAFIYAKEYGTVSNMLDDTQVFTAGQYLHVIEGDFSYKVVLSSGHVSNAGGVQLNVLPGADGKFQAEAFGAKGDGTTDNSPVFVKINTYLSTLGGGVVTTGGGTFSFNSNVPITTFFDLDPLNTTIFERNYSPSVDADGIFSYGTGSSYSSIRRGILRSKIGQTGGCLISIVAGASDALGLYDFQDVNFTTTDAAGTTGTHDYTIYMDGTAKTSAPVGIRGVTFRGCSAFGAATATLHAHGVLKGGWFGGGTYTAGGAATSKVEFSGTSGVKSEAWKFDPTDNTCPINVDYAEYAELSPPKAGAVTNTSNAQYCSFKGYTTSIQNNWSDSVIHSMNPADGLNQDVPIKVRGGKSLTGEYASGNVTLGHVGQEGTTVVASGETFTFDCGSNKLFTIHKGGGQAALCFASYTGSTVSILAGETSVYVNTATPSASEIGISTSTNDHTVSIKNGTGSLENISVSLLGTTPTGSTDPV